MKIKPSKVLTPHHSLHLDIIKTDDNGGNGQEMTR
jgi:hypothetical protein